MGAQKVGREGARTPCGPDTTENRLANQNQEASARSVPERAAEDKHSETCCESHSLVLGPIPIYPCAIYTVGQAAEALRVSPTKFREIASDIPVLGYKVKPRLYWGGDLIEFAQAARTMSRKSQP